MWTFPSALLECPSLGASDPKEGQSRRHNILYVVVTAIIHCHMHGILGYTGHRYSVREEATKDMNTRRQWVFFRDNLREWFPQPFWFDCMELDSIAAGQYNFCHLLLICSEVDICLLFLNHWINTIANFFKMETMSESFFDPPLVVQCSVPRSVLIDVQYPGRLFILNRYSFRTGAYWIDKFNWTNGANNYNSA